MASHLTDAWRRRLAKRVSGVPAPPPAPPKRSTEAITASFEWMDTILKFAKWDWSPLPAIFARYCKVFNDREDPELEALDRDLLRNLFEAERIPGYAIDFVFALFSNDIPEAELVDIRDVMAGLALICDGDLSDRARFILSMYDIDHKGELTEDEAAMMLESLSDTLNRLGIMPFATQDDIDDLTIQLFTSADGEFKAAINADDLLQWAQQCKPLQMQHHVMRFLEALQQSLHRIAGIVDQAQRDCVFQRTTIAAERQGMMQADAESTPGRLQAHGLHFECNNTIHVTLGPILGVITATEARVLMQYSAHGKVGIRLIKQGDESKTVHQYHRFVQAHELVVWVLSGLQPATTYLMVQDDVSADDIVATTATFMTSGSNGRLPTAVIVPSLPRGQVNLIHTLQTAYLHLSGIFDPVQACALARIQQLYALLNQHPSPDADRVAALRATIQQDIHTQFSQCMQMPELREWGSTSSHVLFPPVLRCNPADMSVPYTTAVAEVATIVNAECRSMLGALWGNVSESDAFFLCTYGSSAVVSALTNAVCGADFDLIASNWTLMVAQLGRAAVTSAVVVLPRPLTDAALPPQVTRAALSALQVLVSQHKASVSLIAAAPHGDAGYLTRILLPGGATVSQALVGPLSLVQVGCGMSGVDSLTWQPWSQTPSLDQLKALRANVPDLHTSLDTAVVVDGCSSAVVRGLRLDGQLVSGLAPDDASDGFPLPMAGSWTVQLEIQACLTSRHRFVLDAAATTPLSIEQLVPQPTEITLGPIIGRVASSNATVVAEFRHNATVRCLVTDAVSGQVFATQHSVRANYPQAFVLLGLQPQRRYIVSFSGVVNFRERMGCFTTPNDAESYMNILAVSESGEPLNEQLLNLDAVSPYQPADPWAWTQGPTMSSDEQSSVPKDHAARHTWRQLLSRVSEPWNGVQALLHCGDLWRPREALLECVSDLRTVQYQYLSAAAMETSVHDLLADAPSTGAWTIDGYEGVSIDHGYHRIRDAVAPTDRFPWHEGGVAAAPEMLWDPDTDGRVQSGFAAIGAPAINHPNAVLPVHPAHQFNYDMHELIYSDASVIAANRETIAMPPLHSAESFWAALADDCPHRPQWAAALRNRMWQAAAGCVRRVWGAPYVRDVLASVSNMMLPNINDYIPDLHDERGMQNDRVTAFVRSMFCSVFRLYVSRLTAAHADDAALGLSCAVVQFGAVAVVGMDLGLHHTRNGYYLSNQPSVPEHIATQVCSVVDNPNTRVIVLAAGMPWVHSAKSCPHTRRILSRVCSWYSAASGRSVQLVQVDNESRLAVAGVLASDQASMGLLTLPKLNPCQPSAESSSTALIPVSGDMGSIPICVTDADAPPEKPCMNLRAIRSSLMGGHGCVRVLVTPTTSAASGLLQLETDYDVLITLGPIVGRVTSTACVILLEVDAAVSVECIVTNCYDNSQISVTSTLQRYVPHLFQVVGLSPLTRYVYEFKGVANAIDRVGSFVTPSQFPIKLHVAAVGNNTQVSARVAEAPDTNATKGPPEKKRVAFQLPDELDEDLPANEDDSKGVDGSESQDAAAAIQALPTAAEQEELRLQQSDATLADLPDAWMRLYDDIRPFGQRTDVVLHVSRMLRAADVVSTSLLQELVSMEASWPAHLAADTVEPPSDWVPRLSNFFHNWFVPGGYDPHSFLSVDSHLSMQHPDEDTVPANYHSRVAYLDIWARLMRLYRTVWNAPCTRRALANGSHLFIADEWALGVADPSCHSFLLETVARKVFATYLAPLAVAPESTAGDNQMVGMPAPAGDQPAAAAAPAAAEQTASARRRARRADAWYFTIGESKGGNLPEEDDAAVPDAEGPRKFADDGLVSGVDIQLHRYGGSGIIMLSSVGREVGQPFSAFSQLGMRQVHVMHQWMNKDGLRAVLIVSSSPLTTAEQPDTVKIFLHGLFKWLCRGQERSLQFVTANEPRQGGAEYVVSSTAGPGVSVQCRELRLGSMLPIITAPSSISEHPPASITVPLQTDSEPSKSSDVITFSQCLLQRQRLLPWPHYGTCALVSLDNASYILPRLVGTPKRPQLTLGPIIGRITISSVAILVETDLSTPIRVVLTESMSNVAVYKVINAVGGVPTTVVFEDLMAERRYAVSVQGVAYPFELSSSFMTLGTYPTALNVAAVAEDWPEALLAQPSPWRKLSSMATTTLRSIDYVVHVGGHALSESNFREALLLMAYGAYEQQLREMQCPVAVKPHTILVAPHVTRLQVGFTEFAASGVPSTQHTHAVQVLRRVACAVILKDFEREWSTAVAEAGAEAERRGVTDWASRASTEVAGVDRCKVLSGDQISWEVAIGHNVDYVWSVAMARDLMASCFRYAWGLPQTRQVLANAGNLIVFSDEDMCHGLIARYGIAAEAVPSVLTRVVCEVARSYMLPLWHVTSQLPSSTLGTATIADLETITAADTLRKVREKEIKTAELSRLRKALEEAAAEHAAQKVANKAARAKAREAARKQADDLKSQIRKAASKGETLLQNRLQDELDALQPKLADSDEEPDEVDDQAELQAEIARQEELARAPISAAASVRPVSAHPRPESIRIDGVHFFDAVDNEHPDSVLRVVRTGRFAIVIFRPRGNLWLSDGQPSDRTTLMSTIQKRLVETLLLLQDISVVLLVVDAPLLLMSGAKASVGPAWQPDDEEDEDKDESDDDDDDDDAEESFLLPNEDELSAAAEKRFVSKLKLPSASYGMGYVKEAEWRSQRAALQDLLKMLMNWRHAGNRYNVNGRLRAATRDMVIVAAGLGTCVTTTFTDASTAVQVRQVCVGPVTAPVVNCPIPPQGRWERYKLQHEAVPVVDANEAAGQLVQSVKQRTWAPVKDRQPKMPVPFDAHGFGLFEMKLFAEERSNFEVAGQISVTFIRGGRLGLPVNLRELRRQERLAKFREDERKRKERERITGTREEKTVLALEHDSDEDSDGDDEPSRLWRLPRWWVRLRPDPSVDWPKSVTVSVEQLLRTMVKILKSEAFAALVKEAFTKFGLGNVPITSDQNFGLGSQYGVTESMARLTQIVVQPAEFIPPTQVKVWGEDNKADGAEGDEEDEDEEEDDNGVPGPPKPAKGPPKPVPGAEREPEPEPDPDGLPFPPKETDPIEKRIPVAAERRRAASEKLVVQRAQQEIIAWRRAVQSQAESPPSAKYAWKQLRLAVQWIAEKAFGIRCTMVLPAFSDDYVWGYVTARAPLETRRPMTLERFTDWLFMMLSEAMQMKYAVADDIVLEQSPRSLTDTLPRKFAFLSQWAHWNVSLQIMNNRYLEDLAGARARDAQRRSVPPTKSMADEPAPWQVEDATPQFDFPWQMIDQDWLETSDKRVRLRERQQQVASATASKDRELELLELQDRRARVAPAPVAASKSSRNIGKK